MKVVLLARVHADAGIGASGLTLELCDPSTATTVRREGTELVLTDGPFSAEPVAGLEELAVAGLDEAVRRAAGLPAARVGAVEVRQIQEDADHGPAAADPVGGRRYVLLHVLPAEPVPAVPVDDALLAFLDGALPSSAVVAASRLLPAAPSTAATVRVRDGELLVEPGLADGRTEEIAGYDLLRAQDLDVAIAVASTSTTVATGAIEIRPLVPA